MSFKRKYEFTGAEKDIFLVNKGRVRVKRIRRLSDGLLGGWIESERNLSHKRSCFVYHEAIVCGSSQVDGTSKIFGNATVIDTIVSNSILDGGLVLRNSSVFDSKIIGEILFESSHAVRIILINAYAIKNEYIYSKDLYFNSCNLSNCRNILSTIDEAQSHYNAYINFNLNENDYLTLCNRGCHSVTYVKNNITQKIRANVGCQELITLDKFKDRIFNEGGGLIDRPYRLNYLRQIENIEKMFIDKENEKELIKEYITRFETGLL